MKGGVIKRAGLIAMAITVMTALSGAPAFAQAARTFVSGVGSDSNPCTRTAPCRGFAQAIGVTTAGGEVVALDSAGYGPFTITKAISISAEGVEAAITATTTDGITIAAGANDIVNLRSLVITGAGGANGITFNGGGTLNIQNCVVRGFTNDGIYLGPTNAASVNVSDTVASNNAGSGIEISNPGGAVHAFFERVQVIGNHSNGFSFSGSGALILALVADSVAANNASFGVFDGGNASATFVSSILNNNTDGIFNFTSIALANSRMYSNGIGFDNHSSLKTFGNNDIADTNNLGSLTPVGQQ